VLRYVRTTVLAALLKCSSNIRRCMYAIVWGGVWVVALFDVDSQFMVGILGIAVL
jgi:hypothetical protein